MNGGHRRTTQRPVDSARKSAVWILTGVALAAVLLGFLGLIAFGIDSGIAHHWGLGRVTLALQSAAWISIFGHLIWELLRKGPTSAAKLIPALHEASLLLCLTIALVISIGQQLGWTGAPFRDIAIGISIVVLVGVAAYWTVGERRLTAILEARRVDSPQG